jgi:dihydrofolate reductase
LSNDIIVLVFYELTPFVRTILQGEENKGVELTGGCRNAGGPGNGGGEVNSRQLKGKEGINAESTENAESAERRWGWARGRRSQLVARGAHHLYIDGGITIQRFLRAGLIQRLIITRVPVLIGEGVPVFDTLPHDIRLHHVATRHYPSGLVQSEYQVAA